MDPLTFQYIQAGVTIVLGLVGTKTIEGVPAGVIGTSLRGPAFVPVTVGWFFDF